MLSQLSVSRFNKVFFRFSLFFVLGANFSGQNGGHSVAFLARFQLVALSFLLSSTFATHYPWQLFLFCLLDCRRFSLFFPVFFMYSASGQGFITLLGSLTNVCGIKNESVKWDCIKVIFKSI